MIVDLKNADIYFEDGTSKSGAINNLKSGAINNLKSGAINFGAGYASGVSAIVVNGFTGIIPVGSALTINGQVGYRVTSTAQTAGNTTTINFTPVLVTGVSDTDVVSVSGFALGATALVVDGFTGVVPVGSALTVNAIPGFRVTSTTESAGNTVLINITPALTAVAADNTVVAASGFALGATTLIVDGFTGAVPDGSRIEIDGDDYTVSSATETGSNTTTIVLTSGLLSAQADNVVLTVFGVYLRIKVGDGNITWSEKKPREFKLDRGELDQVRDADQVPMDVSIQLMYEELAASSGDPPTPEDALKRRGAAVDWVSANTDDPCAPYCINIRFDHTPPHCTAVDKERVILPMFYYESLEHDPKQGTISCQGKCNATQPTVTRISQE